MRDVENQPQSRRKAVFSRTVELDESVQKLFQDILQLTEEEEVGEAAAELRSLCLTKTAPDASSDCYEPREETPAEVTSSNKDDGSRKCK